MYRPPFFLFEDKARRGATISGQALLTRKIRTGREQAALDRLTGTRLKTSIETAGSRQSAWFVLVESAHVEGVGGKGRITSLNITLSEWLFNAVLSNEVLSMHPDHFRLRKALERRLYEIARKHCGRQGAWTINLENLYRKRARVAH